MRWVEARNLPKHIGIIMDGNGRWATSRGREREAGHKAGSAAVRRVVRVSRRLGISALTLYAFSEQNWARPKGEVEALMGLLEEYLKTDPERWDELTASLADVSASERRVLELARS